MSNNRYCHGTDPDRAAVRRRAPAWLLPLLIGLVPLGAAQAGTPGPSSTIGVLDGSAIADGIDTVRIGVVLRNAFGNPVIGDQVALVLVSAPIPRAIDPGPNQTTGFTGTATLTATSSAAQSGVQFSVRHVPSGITLGPVTVQFTANVPSTALSTFTAGDGYARTDDASGEVVTVTLINAASNPIPNHSVAVMPVGTPAGLTINPATQLTNAAGQAQFTVTRSVPGAVDLRVTDATAGVTLPSGPHVVFLLAGRLYVKWDATGVNDGSSWTDAFTDLQVGLTLARFGGTLASEVWVAQGVYKPTTPGGLRTASFIPPRIPVYGGFEGDEASLGERDPRKHITTLSGDLNGNDAAAPWGTLPQPAYLSDNSINVVRTDPDYTPVTMDGFVIRGGATDNGPAAQPGGGVRVGGSTANFLNCRFERNWSTQGGGLFASGARVTIVNCEFRENIATTSGLAGAAMCALSATLVCVNTVATENRAIGDSSHGGIAVLSNTNAPSTFTNCSFLGNTATGRGGALYTNANVTQVRNSIVWGNSDSAGSGAQSQLFGITGVAQHQVNYSILMGYPGGFGGTGNTGADPQLIDQTAPGFNTRLQPTSPALERGDATADVDASTAGVQPLPATDVDGWARRVDAPHVVGGGPGGAPFVDIGAHEFRPVLLVDASAGSGGDGRTWPTAFGSLSTALTTANGSGGAFTQVWVAAGLYKTGGANRGRTFELGAGLSLLGGFAGGETSASLAAPDQNLTILSGDIGAVGNPADNNYSVVTFLGPATLDGVEVRDGNADGGSASQQEGGGARILAGPSAVRRCTFTDNFALVGGAVHIADGLSVDLVGVTCTANVADMAAGLWANDATLLFDNCEFSGNTALTVGDGFMLEGGSVVARGLVVEGDATYAVDLALSVTAPLLIDEAALTLRDTTVAGPSRIDLTCGAALLVYGEEAGPLTTLSVPVRGPGSIQVAAGQRLLLNGGASIDLSGAPGDPACYAGALPFAPCATLLLDGTLRIADGTLKNTRVIVNNDVTTESCGNGVGGRIVAESSSAVIRCNQFTAFGDRWLSYSPLLLPPPTVSGNTVKMNITPDNLPGEEGELLELRTLRAARAPPAPADSGAIYLPAPCSGYSDRWALDELRLEEHSRLNLTNRPGFQFGPGDEVLYVRRLVMAPDTVLNTGFNQLFYQEFVDDAGNPLDPAALPPDRLILNRPLLGFSLAVIEFEDACEFRVRVAKSGGSIVRITASGIGGRPIPTGAGGVMQMCTGAAAVASAKGEFAACGEDDVIIAFEYMFPDAAALGEIHVFLSSDSTVGEAGPPIAIIHPPAMGRAGSPTGSRMAVFRARFPRTQDLSNGTYVELQLHGAGSCVWINDFDPYVSCSTWTCGDLNANADANTDDFLTLLAEVGQALEVSDYNSCVDSELTDDRYVDMGDVLAWDTLFHDRSLLNLCGQWLRGPGGGGGGAGTPVTTPPGSFVIAGKPTGMPSGAVALQEDRLFYLDSAGACLEQMDVPASVDVGYGHRGNGRLISDGAGRLYQLHGVEGLVRLCDAAQLVPPMQFVQGMRTISVGLQLGGPDPIGVPLLDAAFHPANPNIVYVAPVLVQEGGDSWRAVAKLTINEGSPTPYVVSRIYGPAPADDPCMNVEPVGASECNPTLVREVEISATGDYLFVLAAAADNDNDYLRIFREDAVNPLAPGAETRVDLGALATPIAAPSALLYVPGSGPTPERLLLTSGVNALDASNTTVYRLDVSRAAGVSAALAGQTTITGMRHVVSLARRAATGQIWALGLSAPDFCARDDYLTSPPECCTFYSSFDELFTTPKRAVFSQTAANAAAVAIACHDLALPVCGAFAGGTGTCFVLGDMNCDSVVNFDDIDPFVAALVSPDAYAAEQPACRYLNGDANRDGAVNFDDISPFVECLILGGCP